MRRGAIIFLATLTMLIAPHARAQSPAIPQFWDVKERLPRPDLTDVPRIRFLTTIDFPPFNFIDSNGLLSGFHVDLARAICRELEIMDRCQIQALPWDELEPAMQRSEGEALIAGLAVTPEGREKYVFSRSYLRFPARFAVRNDSALAEPIYKAIKGKTVGVIAGSEHEAMLRDFFPDAKPAAFDNAEAQFAALKDGKVEAIFGDGMRFGFWLGGSVSEKCCRFAGGPYLAPEYLGNGLAIAVGLNHEKLAAAFDYALREISASGEFEELYLRYFPIGFF